jgi:uncharacterized protein (DUF4415 family)
MMDKKFEPLWAVPNATPDWGRARGVHKQIVTIRLDADALAWFKAQGPGYQTRINQALREFMEANRQPGGGET